MTTPVPPPTLAPSNPTAPGPLDRAAQQHSHPRAPSQSPPSPPSPVPFPPACAYVPGSPRSAHRAAAADAHGNDAGRPRLIYVPGTVGSMSSSAGSDSLMTPISSIDLEKEKVLHPSPRDPEKAMEHVPRPHRPHVTASDAASVAYSDDEREDDAHARRVQEQHAVKILLFLSGPCALLSALNMAWTGIALAITLLSQPVRLCAARPTFGQQLAGLLGPALNLHLRCIYTPLPPHANEDASYHTLTLVAVHLLSPFLSLGVILASWVVAAYWISSAIVGDPAGMDKRDDGKDTALGVRHWWEMWLMRGMKDQ